MGGTGRSALSPKLDGLRGWPSCGESGGYTSREAVTASVRLREGARERLSFKSSIWNDPTSLVSFRGDLQGGRWDQCTLLNALAGIQIAAD